MTAVYDNTYTAAWIEYHLREAYNQTREAYTNLNGVEETFLARQWILCQLMEVFGLPEHLCYDLVDKLEYWEWDNGKADER